MTRRLKLFLIPILCAGLGACALGISKTRADDKADAAAAQATLKTDLQKLIRQDRSPCELKPMTLSESAIGNNTTQRVRFTPEVGNDAVAVIYRPKAGEKFPVVIVQHWLGGSKDNLALLPVLNSLATKGFLVAAIDGRFRGERQNGKSLDVAMLEALKTGKGKPFLIDTAYDITRLIDYLQARPDVDANRIGMVGISEGGMITWLTTAADDRIKVAAPMISVSCLADTFEAPEGPEVAARLALFDSFLKAYAKDINEPQVNLKVLRTAWSKLVPGLLDRFDAQNVVPLIAPRPLLVINHELDELFPLSGAKKVASVVQARYLEAKAPEKFEFKVTPGLKHAAFDFNEVNTIATWMERWLKDAPK
jgi:dienelactone hydrolase